MDGSIWLFRVSEPKAYVAVAGAIFALEMDTYILITKKNYKKINM